MDVDPKEQAELDQNQAMLAEMVTIYYRELRARGMDAQQAMFLTLHYQNMVVLSHGEAG